MQDYAQFSKFYLKRNWREKENVITFICSCISQKRQPHSRQSISGAEGHFCKEQKQKETFDSEEKKGDIMHRDVLCRECQEFQFSGVRFMCVECQNYNLCQKCERKKPHNTEHLLIKFNKNMSDSEIDYEKYSCYFANIDENNGIKFEAQTTKENTIYVDIVNDGKLSLVNCFIMSIGYKANYIDGKKTQVKNIDKGNKDRVKLTLDNKPPGEYTSKWRVFLKNGYPIGNVLTFHVSIQ